MMAVVNETTMAYKPTARSWRTVHLVVLSTFVLLAGYLRFEGLGVRSLWRDELCTWYVSRMDFRESLRWGPELSKPPLYQFVLRALTSDPRPSESWLRFPAAVCGLLTVLVGWRLGRIAGEWQVGLAAAGLLACNGLQIYYSQECRPYTMLILGSALSTLLWYRMVVGGQHRYFFGYIVTAALTLHAHYLAALTIVAQFVWWLAVRSRRPSGGRHALQPLISLVVTAVLCAGIVFRYLYLRSSMFQGLEWIKPPTWQSTLDVLGRMTFGWQWVFGLLVPSVALWALASFRPRLARPARSGGALFAGAEDICGLLLAWLACAWFGLLVVSWVAHPAMVARYALPAAIPALLLPLIISFRLDRRAPLVIMLVFVAGAAPDWWIARGYASLHPPESRTDPGLRELASYLQANVDPQTEVVVLTLDATIYPGWEDSERIIFDYYPLRGIPVAELRLGPDNVTAQNDVLKDPRGMYLIVLWADEMEILKAAGRKSLPIKVRSRAYDRLLFTPYRLVHVAPLVPRR